jgi:hypothetical protein
MVSKNPVVDSNKLERGEVWGETNTAVHWAGAFAAYGGHGTTASSTIVYEVEPASGLAGTPTPPRRPNTSLPAPASFIWKTAPLGLWALEACSCFRRRRATISKTPGKRRSGRSRSSPQRCSPRTSTR